MSDFMYYKYEDIVALELASWIKKDISTDGKTKIDNVHAAGGQCALSIGSDNCTEGLLSVNFSRAPSLGEVYLIDVRQLEEYRESHIPGAILLPLQDLNYLNLLEAINEHKNNHQEGSNSNEGSNYNHTSPKIVVFYCRSGVRSAAAVEIIKDELIKASKLEANANACQSTISEYQASLRADNVSSFKNLLGGIIGWIELGLPVIRPSAKY